MRRIRTAGLILVAGLCAMAACSKKDGSGEAEPSSGEGDANRPDSTTGGDAAPTCEAGVSAGDVAEPEFVANLKGETSWFAGPIVYDLDGDGSNELIAAYYSVFVFDSNLNLIAEADGGEGRIYAPHVIADLEGDGVTEIIYGNDHEVYAYEYKDGELTLKDGWPADTTSADNPPEVRGLAAEDLDGDGSIEIVATTTQTVPSAEGGAQVFVFSADGTLYQPNGISWDAWPRYNSQSGEGNDADRNGQGHDGYGQYGLNVGIGDIDDDPELEILATYDNHHIQAFNHDGTAIDAAPWFTNRANEFDGERLTWGQFIRWADPQVEADHYNLHTGQWPHPSWAEWLQWTASPPNVADLDGDGRNEIIGVPNVEMNEPYETQAYALMVLEGNNGDGSRSAMRKAGFEDLPRGGPPIAVDGWYPPGGVPAPTTVDLQGDADLEIVVSMNDGFTHAFDSAGKELWQYEHALGHPIMFASETTVADLNQDGSPELVLSTYGDPNVEDSGHLIVLAANGAPLFEVPLPNPGNNGNGNGAPAAPGIGDLDGDGQLEIFVQTFDHGMDVFTVPGSSDNCVLWATSRGGALRTGSTEKSTTTSQR